MLLYILYFSYKIMTEGGDKMTENMEQNTLGLRIAECRRKSNLTQEELANRLGVTPQALSQYERGTRYPDIELLKRLM